ncbi:TonB-dependent siderophore receptor [Novosphingobium humi]|uniref:TonB-dependent receptor n=1 Tax=Novosphingobium humi TaxID=2282397 RepID=A0ABY7U267_9SPHN|nr:TonB-dependent receptor [Novosphingobium humi]WCT78279.1 TonB-dependent receptor [Novosphingobium humi]
MQSPLSGLLMGASLLPMAAFLMPSAAMAQTTQGAPENAKPTAPEIIVTGRFIASGAASATKQNVSTLETPFSVSAYTGDFMKAVQTTQVADLYRYMTGLQKAGSTGYDITLRGFSTTANDRNTVMVDGLPGLSVRFGSPPTVGTEHVEVVKGAASLLYGSVQPGGFVNMITKKPSAIASTEISARGTVGGSSRGSRVQGGDLAIDSTGALTGDGALLYRFVAQGSTDNYFRDRQYERGLYLAPSLTWHIGASSSLMLQVEYRKVKTSYANVYLLAPTRAGGTDVSWLAPYNTNYSSPTDNLREEGLTESLTFTHDFGQAVKWTVALRNVDHIDTASAFDINGYNKKDTTFSTLDLRARGQHNYRSYAFADTYLTIKGDTGPINHRLIVGASIGKEVDDFTRLQYCQINSPDKPNADATCNPTTAQYTISVQHPDFSGIPPLSYFGAGALSPKNRSRSYGINVDKGAYISDLITWLPQLKTTLGLRYATADQTQYANLLQTPPVPGDTHVSNSALLPQAGLIYQPTRHFSFYASYSTSFSPVPGGTQDVNGNFNFKPTRGTGYEVGAKTELGHGLLTATLALFRIDQTNIIVPSTSTACSTGSCSQQIGAARSRGIELEFTARPLPGWSLIGGWAHTLARVTQNNDPTSGPIPGGAMPNAPEDAVHLWSRYDFSAGALKNLGLGIGYSYTGTRIAYTPTVALPTPFTVPSYSVVDLGVYYTFNEHLHGTLKVNNLFDQYYYASGNVVSGMVNVIPGTPRTIMANLSYKL